VKTKSSRRHFRFELPERLLDATVELRSRLDEGNAALLRVAQEIFGVVEQAHVERLESEPRERTAELVRKPLRMNAMSQAVGDFHDLGKRFSAGFALQDELEVLSLCVANLRNDHDRVSRDFFRSDELCQN